MKYLTTGDISRETGAPEWKIRRIVDRLEGIERFGLKRMIPASRLKDVLKKLKESSTA